MENTQKTHRKSHFHAYYNLKYHLVLVTRYRRKCLTNQILERLREVCGELSESWSVKVVEFGGEADHVHLLIDAHPSMDMSKYINNLKTVSSRYIRKEHRAHLDKYLWGGGLWSRAYCLLTVSSNGAPLDVIRQYIESQERPAE